MYWNTYSNNKDKKEEKNIQKNQTFKRIKKLAVINEKKVVSEPILEFLKSDTQYEWKIDFNRESAIVADLVFGFRRSNCQFCQAFSYIQNIDAYDNKRLWKDLLRRFDNISKFEMKSHQMHPESYVINFSSSDYTIEEKQLMELKSYGDLFIEKDPVGLDGKGIQMIGDLQEYQQNIKKIKKEQNTEIQKNKSQKQVFRVLQKYIHNPLLLGGRKFDFRCFVLVLCVGYNYIYFFQHGYVRSCVYPYDTDDINIEKHTTHTGHVKKLKDQLSQDQYTKKIAEAQITMQDFEEEFLQEYKVDQQFLEDIYFKIKQSLTYGFLAGQNYLERKQGAFHLFGCDVLLDNKYNAYFLEPNVYPNLQLFSSTKQKSLLPVVFLVELCRHGARSPMYDNLDAKTNWNPPNSHLTQVGMRQHYLLGKQFHKEYVRGHYFLPKTFNTTEVKIQSTGNPRTQTSAQSQMYGLYYQSAENLQSYVKFNKDLSLPPYPINNGEVLYDQIGEANLPNSYQPIPVFASHNDAFNFALDPRDSCPKIKHLQKLNKLTDQTQQFYLYLNEKGVIKRFRELFNIPDSQQVDIKLIGEYYDTLYCDLFQQLPFPSNITQNDWDWINFVYNYQNLYLDFNQQLNIKLQVSVLLREIQQEIEGALFQNSQRKFLFYSASDGNVNALNLAFGVVNYTVNFEEYLVNKVKFSNAPFASTAIIEVYEENDQYYFLYKYNGVPYNICNNSEKEQNFCSYDQFMDIIDQWSFEMEEYLKECEISSYYKKKIHP